MRSIFFGGVVAAFLSIVGCEDNSPSERTGDWSSDQVLAEAQLNSLSYDFRLWDILATQDAVSSEVRVHVANSIVRHLLLTAAVDYEVADLHGDALEALCRATTEEVRTAIERHGHADMGRIALDYLEQIRPTVLSEVNKAQGNLAREECRLSFRSH